MLGTVDLAAGAAAFHLLAAAAVNPVAADHLVLVKGPIVLRHLEEASITCLQFDAVVCVTVAHDFADHVMCGLAAAAAAAAAAAESCLLQLLAPCCTASNCTGKAAIYLKSMVVQAPGAMYAASMFLKKCQACVHFKKVPAPCAYVVDMSEVLLLLPLAIAGLSTVSPGLPSCRQWLMIGPDCSRTMCCLNIDRHQCCKRRRYVFPPHNSSSQEPVSMWIAVHCSISLHPTCCDIMSQLITGDYLITIKRNS